MEDNILDKLNESQGMAYLTKMEALQSMQNKDNKKVIIVDLEEEYINNRV